MRISMKGPVARIFALSAVVIGFSSDCVSAFSSCNTPLSSKTHGLLKNNRQILTNSKLSTTPLSSRDIISSLKASSRKGDDDFVEDPNPGGMSDWDEGTKNKQEGGGGESFLQSVKNWLRSDEAKEDAKTYTISLIIALFLRWLIIEPRYIPSLSMYPTFDVGDQLAVEKVTKRLGKPFYRNEVVVFNPPEAFKDIVGIQNKKSKEALIKRIIAVEGDTVEMKGGKLYINGDKVDEPFTAEDAQYDFGPIVVPANEVLCLGDNRNHSLDGHIWGFLPTQNVIGRAVFIYWPPWRVGNSGMF